MNATTLPLTHSRPNLAVPIAALLAGAALSAGVIALADTNEVASPPAAKVIVLDAPPTPGQGVQAKNEAAVAGAIAFGPQLRGSKASAIAPPATEPAPQPSASQPAGARGLAAGLSGR